jgi:hypothetical protein
LPRDYALQNEYPTIILCNYGRAAG